MQLELSATHFPTTKHLRLVIESVEGSIDAVAWLLATYITFQTDALSYVWDATTKTLTIQGFVHSDENC